MKICNYLPWLAPIFIGLFLAASQADASDLNLTITNEDGFRDIDFGVVQSLDDTGEVRARKYRKEVRIEINNTGSDRYTLYQQFNQPPHSDGGFRYPIDLIKTTLRVESGIGVNRAINPISARMGRQELYLSGMTGEDVIVYITYEIEIPGLQESGTYNTNITYKAQSI